MNDSDSDNEIDIPCVGVCIVDEAGYCLGCGRPPAPVATADARPAATASPPADQPAAASAVSTTLTQ